MPRSRGERAQLAVGAAGAGLAVAVVLGEQQLDDRAASRLRAMRRVGLDDHALGDGGPRRRPRGLGALDLDQADAAGADGLHVLRGSRGVGTLDAGLTGGFQDGRAVRDLDLDVVYGQGWHQRFTSLGTGLSVVAAEAAPRLGDGDLGPPTGARPRRSCRRARWWPRSGDAGARRMDGVGVGVEGGVDGDFATPEGVVDAGQIRVDGDGGLLAGCRWRLRPRTGPVTASPPAKIHSTDVRPSLVGLEPALLALDRLTPSIAGTSSHWPMAAIT